MEDALIATINYKSGQRQYQFMNLGAIGKKIIIRGSAAKAYNMQLAEVEVLGGDLGKSVALESCSVIAKYRFS